MKHEELSTVTTAQLMLKSRRLIDFRSFSSRRDVFRVYLALNSPSENCLKRKTLPKNKNNKNFTFQCRWLNERARLRATCFTLAVRCDNDNSKQTRTERSFPREIFSLRAHTACSNATGIALFSLTFCSLVVFGGTFEVGLVILFKK